MRLILVRHGETDYNRDGLALGQSDAPLNETGLRQAKALEFALAPEKIAAIYASLVIAGCWNPHKWLRFVQCTISGHTAFSFGARSKVLTVLQLGCAGPARHTRGTLAAANFLLNLTRTPLWNERS